MKYFLIYALLFICFCCCEKQQENHDNKVYIRIKKFPTSLNYLTATSSVESIIQQKIFETLFSFGPKSSLEPHLVNDFPLIEIKNDTIILSFEIRNDATWGDGEPITGEDILFSLKALKLPFSNNINSRVYLERIKGVIIDSINSKKITFYAKGSMSDVTSLTGDFDILQKSKYDSLGLLNDITFYDIENNPEKIANDENVKLFIDEFLKDNFKFKGKYLNGSGPYEIAEIEHGKFIRLKKKKTWWGERLEGKFPHFQANPEEIIYICIPEALVAIQALKSKSIDVLGDIPSSEFIQLKNNEAFLKDYNLFSPVNYKFTYIGLNSRAKHLNNKEIRKAISYLINVDDMIKVVERGYGQKTIGPINPVNEYYYNDKIVSRNWDSHLAQEMFLKNGFILEDGKLIDKTTNDALTFNVSYRQNPGYESIAKLLKNEAEKLGITIQMNQYEGRTMSKKARNHDFEIIVGAFNGNPSSLNFSGIFSQEAKKIGGMNFTGFGNYKTDSLIQAANYAEDSVSKRSALYAFQEELHEEATMFFLYFSKNKIAINKKFDNLNISSMKPGYDVTSFILKNPQNSN